MICRGCGEPLIWTEAFGPGYWIHVTLSGKRCPFWPYSDKVKPGIQVTPELLDRFYYRAPEHLYG